MKTKIFFTALVGLTISTTTLNAEEFDLRVNMLKLHTQLNSIQSGFLRSDRKAVLAALDDFAKNSDTLLGNKNKMIKMLPEEMRNKKHKVNIAVESARKINYSAKVIKDTAFDETIPVLKRQSIAQEAYLDIVNACFRCHNLVRDKKRLRSNF